MRRARALSAMSRSRNNTPVPACQATKNAVFVLPGGWFNACALGVTGDWVIRLVIDCNPCPWDCGDGDGDVDVVDFFFCGDFLMKEFRN